MRTACRVDLSRARWQNRDLAMLQGCWHRITEMDVKNVTSGAVTSLSAWTFCFGSDGVGVQRIVGTHGSSCSGPATASFQNDGTLEIDTAFCDGSLPVLPESFPCRWRDDKAADCPGFLSGRHPVPFWPGGFHPGLFMR